MQYSHVSLCAAYQTVSCVHLSVMAVAESPADSSRRRSRFVWVRFALGNDVAVKAILY
jgi:hypothetical protein